MWSVFELGLEGVWSMLEWVGLELEGEWSVFEWAGLEFEGSWSEFEWVEPELKRVWSEFGWVELRLGMTNRVWYDLPSAFRYSFPAMQICEQEK